jgi:hypothetical protein
MIRFDVNNRELPRVQAAVQIAARHYVGMNPADSSWPRSELISDLVARRHHDALLFAGAVDLGGDELAVPMYELGTVSIVIYLDRDLFAFAQPDQGSRDLTIVTDGTDSLVFRDVH